MKLTLALAAVALLGCGGAEGLMGEFVEFEAYYVAPTSNACVTRCLDYRGVAADGTVVLETLCAGDEGGDLLGEFMAFEVLGATPPPRNACDARCLGWRGVTPSGFVLHGTLCVGDRADADGWTYYGRRAAFQEKIVWDED